MRNIQSLSKAAGDPFLEGLGKIWEGFSFGMAASIWGDLPYSEASTSVTQPKLDTQLEIYNAVQLKLDTGITLLQGAPTTGGCEASDVVYCATGITRAVEIGRWVRAANTIKARFYLHLAERQGAAAYALALAAAQNGINEVPTSVNNAIDGQGPGDFRSWHGTTLDQDGNIWAEFLTSRLDLAAGDVMVQILKAHCPTCAGAVDPRLARYFDPAGGQFVGKDRNNNSVPSGATASGINTAVRRALPFRQPIVTWAENQLIIAEASCVPDVTVKPTGKTCTNAGGVAAALTAVNAVRTSVGVPALGAFSATPMDDIMTEKYIAQYQNIDVWNDYKRTCLPGTIAPPTGSAEVMGRMVYGQGERNANANIPAPNIYPAGTSAAAVGSPFRNWNDPNSCQ
jgi:hypothetical protein